PSMVRARRSRGLFRATLRPAPLFGATLLRAGLAAGLRRARLPGARLLRARLSVALLLSAALLRDHLLSKYHGVMYRFDRLFEGRLQALGCLDSMDPLSDLLRDLLESGLEFVPQW